MFKLDLEKAKEPEIKLLISVASQKMQENSRKTSIFVSLIMLKPLTVWIIKKLWKVIKEMGIPDHRTSLLRNLYAGQEATIRTGYRTLGKDYVKAVYCHPAYLTYMQSTSWEMLDWMKHKLESDCQEKYQ